MLISQHETLPQHTNPQHMSHDRRRMDRVGGVLPIKLRSEKTMQSKSGGKDKEKREREKCEYSLRQWNDQNDEGARAKRVAVGSTSKRCCWVYKANKIQQSQQCREGKQENTRKKIIQAVKRTVRPIKKGLKFIIHASIFVQSQLLSNMMKKKL